VDGDGVWVAWKPGISRDVDLVHADKTGCQRYGLEVGKNRRGQDIWPHLSLTTADDGKRYIAYFAGNAFASHQTSDPEDPARPAYCIRHPFQGPDLPPNGPAEFSCFDVDALRTRWTYNITANYPDFPVNWAQQYQEQSSMVAAGNYAYVGWVDTKSSPTAQLALLAFDLRSATASPIFKEFPLEFSSKEFPHSLLSDIIAVDGQIYALITRADANYTWSNQKFSGQAVVCLKSKQ
jgi:hypothetical protein